MKTETRFIPVFSFRPSYANKNEVRVEVDTFQQLAICRTMLCLLAKDLPWNHPLSEAFAAVCREYDTMLTERECNAICRF